MDLLRQVGNQQIVRANRVERRETDGGHVLKRPAFFLGIVSAVCHDKQPYDRDAGENQVKEQREPDPGKTQKKHCYRRDQQYEKEKREAHRAEIGGAVCIPLQTLVQHFAVESLAEVALERFKSFSAFPLLQIVEKIRQPLRGRFRSQGREPHVVDKDVFSEGLNFVRGVKG